MKQALLFLFPALGLAPLLLSQPVNGSLRGTVFDAGGRPIPNAQLVAENSARKFRREAASGRDGTYLVAELPAGSYQVSASAVGFSAVHHSAILILVGSSTAADFHLPLAGLSQTIEVSDTAPIVAPESAGVGIVLDRRRVEGLPLNRRDFLQLALLAPGVSPPVEESELSSRGAFAMHAGGAREEYNNFRVDGADNNDAYVNRYVVQQPVDAIQEFQVLTQNYSAEYGRSAGGQVNVVTRSGGSSWHGFLYEYWRNSVLDARNFFDGSELPKFNRNQFGGGVGGPAWRDRTFVFANVDALTERRGFNRLSSVPLAAHRTGDLSSLGQVVLDPFTRQPFPGSVIPDSRISPIARNVLSLFPQPNRLGAAGNYTQETVLSETTPQGNVRLDQILTASTRLMFRYSAGHIALFEPYTEDTATIPGFGDFVDDMAQNGMARLEQSFGSSWMHSAVFSYSRLSRNLLPEGRGADAASQLGVSWLPSGTAYPVFNVAGYSKLGDSTNLPIRRSSSAFLVADSWSVLKGQHQIKFGGEVRPMRLQSRLDLLTRGSLSFSGALSGSGIGDLLLGLPSFALRADADNPMSLRSISWGLYAQDDWRITRRLTLSMGLRYEYVSPAEDPNNGMATLDFATGTILDLGQGGSSRSGISPDRNNLAPRVGLAYGFAGDWSMRAGYGIYYDGGFFETSTAQYFNPPRFKMRVWFPSQYALLTLANPFPTTGGYSPAPSLNVLNPDFVNSYLQHWSYSLQGPLRRLGTISIAFAGSKGTSLVRTRDLNQPSPAPGDIQARRPYPAFGSILFIESAAVSNYNALQVSFQRPLMKSLSLWLAYTAAKSLDDASAFLSTKGDKNFPQNSQSVRAERGLSSFDTPQRLALSAIYTLPQGNKWTRNSEIRSILVAQSGQAFSPLLRFDNSNTGNTGGNFGSDRPDAIGTPALSEPGPSAWFNTAAFRVAPRYTFGNSGRNVLRGPGLFSLDLSLARQFSLSERFKLQAEAQAFNLTNHTNFLLPENYSDEPASFGRIFGARPARQLQLVIRLQF